MDVGGDAWRNLVRDLDDRTLIQERIPYRSARKKNEKRKNDEKKRNEHMNDRRFCLRVVHHMCNDRGDVTT